MEAFLFEGRTDKMNIDNTGEIKGIVSKQYDEKQLSHAETFEVFKKTIGTVGVILGKDL